MIINTKYNYLFYIGIIGEIIFAFIGILGLFFTSLENYSFFPFVFLIGISCPFGGLFLIFWILKNRV